MAKKKTLVEKAVDAVDHLIHPEEKPSTCPITSEPCTEKCELEECKAADVSPENSEPLPADLPKESSSIESGIANHPKFDKYKPSGGQPK